MALSEDDKKRIEEEEYRKHVQSQLRNTRRIDLDLRGDQRIETHGVGREIYRDFKNLIGRLPSIVFWTSVIFVELLLIGGLLEARSAKTFLPQFLVFLVIALVAFLVIRKKRRATRSD